MTNLLLTHNMLYEPGYFVDQSMYEYCCKMMLDSIYRYSEDKTIAKIDVPDWVKTDFMVSTSELIKYGIPRGEWGYRLSNALNAMAANKNLFEQPGFAKGTIWGSLKLYDQVKD